MKAKFLDGGYTIHIGGPGVCLEEAPNSCHSMPDGMVAFSVTHLKIRPIDDPETGEEIACAMYLKPSHARAIASAMLSAATEAKG